MEHKINKDNENAVNELLDKLNNVDISVKNDIIQPDNTKMDILDNRRKYGSNVKKVHQIDIDKACLKSGDKGVLEVKDLQHNPHKKIRWKTQKQKI